MQNWNLAAEFPFSPFSLNRSAGFPFWWKWEKLGRVSKMYLLIPLQSTTTRFYILASHSASPYATTRRLLQQMVTLLNKACVFPQVCVHLAWWCELTVMVMSPQVVQPSVDGFSTLCMADICSMHWCAFYWTLRCRWSKSLPISGTLGGKGCHSSQDYYLVSG